MLLVSGVLHRYSWQFLPTREYALPCANVPTGKREPVSEVGNVYDCRWRGIKDARRSPGGEPIPKALRWTVSGQIIHVLKA